jgi:hypothetical protein
MERYQVWVSANAENKFSSCNGDCMDSGCNLEVEFLLVAYEGLIDARATCSKMLDYPAITAAWVIRSNDGEVVQPHEKF